MVSWCRGGSGSQHQHQQARSRGNLVRREVDVDEAYVGLVIGKGGCNCKQLQSLPGIRKFSVTTNGPGPKAVVEGETAAAVD